MAGLWLGTRMNVVRLGLKTAAERHGLGTAAEHLGAVMCVSSRHYKSSSNTLSAAAQQKNAGDQTTKNDDHTPQQPYTLEDLEKKTNKLEEEVRVLTERCGRALADAENIRRRTQKFVEDAKMFGIQSFCRDLVEVADSVEKALEQAAEEEMKEVLSQLDGKLKNVFTKHGLEKMTSLGGKYDPYSHEIVCRIPASDVKPGTVAVVKQVGYKLHGRTIRHAHVGLAVEAQK